VHSDRIVLLFGCSGGGAIPSLAKLANLRADATLKISSYTIGAVASGRRAHQKVAS